MRNNFKVKLPHARGTATKFELICVTLSALYNYLTFLMYLFYYENPAALLMKAHKKGKENFSASPAETQKSYAH